MENRRVIVTGANAGIGRATTEGLAQLGANVIMVCRDKKKAEKALKDIQEETGNNNLDLMICDFASLNSISEFVQDFKKKYNKLDVLVNNHGAVFLTKSYTEDGLESTFAVNHLGYFSLTLQLLESLKLGTNPKIVNVSSSSNYRVKKLEIEDYNWEKRRYYLMDAYAESKLYNIMFTFFLAEKLKEFNITVNCLHPGYVKTKIGLNNFFLKLLKPLVKMGGMSLEEGAKTSLYVIESSELDEVTGKFFVKLKDKKPNELAYDKEKQKELWELSLKLSKLENIVI
jgi:NAD(P)-dependent dehydrogenase (short-subunit alcohol dehydrogenase family)